MVTWIVVALVLVPLVVFALAVRPLLARLPRLRRAALALQGRAAEAETLREAAETLQERAEAVQRQLDTAGQRVALIQAKRGE
ncbi:hypothetical protein [Micromonospora endolithica]|uniref:Uncharacterized protein n=1 Tax=Micromonospora endolithica TaxID=230091 RepID=A0A3A9YZS9_9ACTN|nr:hypothetical protein [Micromonospora endolithica]RKN41568.1 hypothetical protein D7223_24655 [Micromonospora endolithica]TWJ21963.1 hypothetical protein JD76_02077 [Micromonospora endolithica]